MEKIKLRMAGIEKAFPGVKALRNVDFSVRSGNVQDNVDEYIKMYRDRGLITN